MVEIDANVFRNSEREFTKIPAKHHGFPGWSVVKYFKKQSINKHKKKSLREGEVRCFFMLRAT